MINELENDEILQTGHERKSTVTGKKVTDYINNKALSKAVIEYNERHVIRMEKGLPQERIPDVIGLAILKIADGLGSRYNFRNYTYLDEMVGDATVQGVYSVTKFNLDKIMLTYMPKKLYFTLLPPHKYKTKYSDDLLPEVIKEREKNWKEFKKSEPITYLIFSGVKIKEPNAYGYFTFNMWRKMTNRIIVEKEQQQIIEDLMSDPNYVCYEADENDNDSHVDISKENAVDFYYDGKLGD